MFFAYENDDLYNINMPEKTMKYIEKNRIVKMSEIIALILLIFVSAFSVFSGYQKIHSDLGELDYIGKSLDHEQYP